MEMGAGGGGGEGKDMGHWENRRDSLASTSRSDAAGAPLG